MKKFLQFCFILFVTSFPLWAEINLISPVSGVWANKQMLVIDNSNGGDFFYSIDGADPETFGFAYDGPVLLDVSGEVKLNITCISSDNKKEKKSVSYTVNANDGSKTTYKDFIQTFFSAGILNYSAGTQLEIPTELLFYIGNVTENNSNENFIPARTLQLSSYSVLSRFIPCTVYDQERDLKYRFIIKTYPQSAGVYSRRDVPFEISDWETITFIDNNFIYKVDSEYWGLPTEPVKIDRRSSHMISWQPLEYEQGNPVEFFVLPPRPEIIKQELDDGCFIYSIRGDPSYSLSVLNEASGEYSELFTKIGVDAFYGDEVNGTLTLGIFANSVYQGEISVSYDINRKPPLLPVIKTNAEGFVTRGSVDVRITGTPGSELYIALSEPLVLEDSEKTYKKDDEIFKKVTLGEYKRVKKDNFSLRWTQNGANPVYYKVSAYSKTDGNISNPVEFAVVIDQSNYYFDSLSDSSVADGTLAHPYTDFDQFADLLLSQRTMKLIVKGEMLINKPYFISANFGIIDGGNAKIKFGENGSLTLKGSTLEILDCRISNVCDKTKISIEPLIKLENSVLTMKNCVISMEFAKNGTVVEGTNGIINVSDSIVSVNAISYVSFIVSVKTRVSLQNCSINTNAETTIIISADGGNINALKNNFLVSGGNGRIAELFGVTAIFKENNFKARFTNEASKVLPIYVNKNSKLTAQRNTTEGF